MKGNEETLTSAPGFLQRNAIYFAWAIALAGFFISIFFGEVMQNDPCPLCWYQRIALFPLALMLGMAAYRGDSSIVPYALPLALIGAAIATFHSFEESFPILQKSGICSLGDACVKSAFNIFGFIDFPSLSAAGFILISALLFIGRKRD